MEIGVDFGLFELLAIAGLAWLARFIFRRRWLSVAFLMCSAAAPIALWFLVDGEWPRWLAVACLGAAAIHITVIAQLMRRFDVGQLLESPLAGEGELRRG